MPLIKSAIKKVRKDKARTARNEAREKTLKTAVKVARRTKTEESLTSAFSALDKAAKVKLIHPNKAARLKSRLSKQAPKTAIKSPTKSKTNKR